MGIGVLLITRGSDLEYIILTAILLHSKELYNTTLGGMHRLFGLCSGIQLVVFMKVVQDEITSLIVAI